MTDSYAHIDGLDLQEVTLHFPWVGPWIADYLLLDETPVSGAVTLVAGDLTLQGTVKPDDSGTHLRRASGRIVAGAGGWATTLVPQGYHNDAGVKAALVADDAARAAGETLDLTDFAPLVTSLGANYVRAIGPASRALEDAIGGVPWWVDAAGVTHVKPRPTPEASPDLYDILEYDPHRRLATISVDDISTIGVGSILTKELDSPQTVRDLTVKISREGLMLEAWCGSGDGRSRAAGLLDAIAKRATDDQIHGLWRYRVVRVVANRLELQAVRQSAGLPDLILVSMWPGAPGIHGDPEPGSECVVQFIEGDRTQPIVTHFVGKDGASFIPVALELAGADFKVARQGDLVQSGGTGTIVMFSGVSPMVAGSPYLVSFGSAVVPPILPTPVLATPLYGAVITGSDKVSSG